MTQTHAATPSLAALVDELVVYLQDQHKLQDTPHPGPPPPEGLERVYDTFTSSLLPLSRAPTTGSRSRNARRSSAIARRGR